MKSLKLFFLVCLLSPFCAGATETMLCDFESNQTVTPVYGATEQIVDNPSIGGLNTSTKCLQIGRTSTNWYELNDIPVSFTIPAGGVKIIHILIKYSAQPDISIRVNTTGTDIRPIAPYTQLGQWQNMRFLVSNSGTTDLVVTQLRFLGDLGYNNIPAGRILSSSVFGYIDNIRVSDSEYLTTNSILNFEDQNDTEAKADISTQSSDYTLSNYYENPESVNANNTQRCLFFMSPTALKNTTKWWYGAKIGFLKPVKTSTDRQYLHVMMRKNPTDDGTVVISNASTNFISAVLTDVWTDYVSSAITASEIDELYFKTNAGANVGCYLDEIWIDNDPNPRTALSAVPSGTSSTIGLSPKIGACSQKMSTTSTYYKKNYRITFPETEIKWDNHVPSGYTMNYTLTINGKDFTGQATDGVQSDLNIYGVYGAETAKLICNYTNGTNSYSTSNYFPVKYSDPSLTNNIINMTADGRLYKSYMGGSLVAVIDAVDNGSGVSAASWYELKRLDNATATTNVSDYTTPLVNYYGESQSAWVKNLTSPHFRDVISTGRGSDVITAAEAAIAHNYAIIPHYTMVKMPILSTEISNYVTFANEADVEGAIVNSYSEGSTTDDVWLDQRTTDVTNTVINLTNGNGASTNYEAGKIPTGLIGVSVDNVTISGGEGIINITGANNAEVYDFMGRMIKSVNNQSIINVPSGLYIVKAGGKVSKVKVD
ncbi:MAG: hypothetical protein LKF31_01520 [Muribaculaceae bacterium]|jgi:hypothetical protein|nr:hypothetical protein [Muribaculaceae bacterium]